MIAARINRDGTALAHPLGTGNLVGRRRDRQTAPAKAEPAAGPPSVYDDGGTAGAHHQHAAALADDFVVEVDADDRVAALLPCRLRHLLQGQLAGITQFRLVGR